jgi:hypothetical protein
MSMSDIKLEVELEVEVEVELEGEIPPVDDDDGGEGLSGIYFLKTSITIKQ